MSYRRHRLTIRLDDRQKGKFDQALELLRRGTYFRAFTATDLIHKALEQFYAEQQKAAAVSDSDRCQTDSQKAKGTFVRHESGKQRPMTECPYCSRQVEIVAAKSSKPVFIQHDQVLPSGNRIPCFGSLRSTRQGATT